MQDPQYCYHGTTHSRSVNILKEGFNEGTWFSTHLEDAIEYGGEYVFMVEFPFILNRNWQFREWKKSGYRTDSLTNPIHEEVNIRKGDVKDGCNQDRRLQSRPRRRPNRTRNN